MTNEREKSDGSPLRHVALKRGFQNLHIFCQSKIGRGVVACVLVVAAGAPIAAATLNYNGYCFAENRFFSDDEFIDSALQAALMPGGSLAKIHQANPPLSSIDTRKFRDANPDCCTFEKHNTGDNGPYVSFSQRVFGRGARIVRVSITSRFNPSIMGQFAQYAVENCGRAWRSNH